MNVGLAIMNFFEQLNQDLILVAHDVSFDMRFFLHAMDQAGLTFPPNIKYVIDTCPVFRNHYEGNENSPGNFKAEVIYEFLFGKKPEGAHFADSDVDALCSMVTKQPFLVEIRAAVQPVGTFRQAYINLKEKWQKDQDELGEEDEDDQLNSDGDETE